MTVNLYGKEFKVSGTWKGRFVEETNEKPEYIVESIIYEGREISRLIENKPIYWLIIEKIVSSC
jgi:hypothetical protein